MLSYFKRNAMNNRKQKKLKFKKKTKDIITEKEKPNKYKIGNFVAIKTQGEGGLKLTIKYFGSYKIKSMTDIS